MALATMTQSVRFIPPAAVTGAGYLDSLNRLLADLCTRNPKVCCPFFILIFGKGSVLQCEFYFLKCLRETKS